MGILGYPRVPARAARRGCRLRAAAACPERVQPARAPVTHALRGFVDWAARCCSRGRSCRQRHAFTLRWGTAAQQPSPQRPRRRGSFHKERHIKPPAFSWAAAASVASTAIRRLRQHRRPPRRASAAPGNLPSQDEGRGTLSAGRAPVIGPPLALLLGQGGEDAARRKVLLDRVFPRFIKRKKIA